MDMFWNTTTSIMHTLFMNIIICAYIVHTHRHASYFA
jgi:hypothetical protein